MKDAHNLVPNAANLLLINAKGTLRVDEMDFGAITELHHDEVSLLVTFPNHGYEWLGSHRQHALLLCTENGVGVELLLERGHERRVLVAGAEEQKERPEVVVEQNGIDSIATRVHKG